MTTPTKDRLSKLLAPTNTTLNGIDFVEIASPDETTLRLHFLNTVNFAGSPPGPINPLITGGETIPTVSVLPISPADWSQDVDGRPLLTLRVAAPGDFSFLDAWGVLGRVTQVLWSSGKELRAVSNSIGRHADLLSSVTPVPRNFSSPGCLYPNRLSPCDQAVYSGR